MRADGARLEIAIHASAVAIDGQALLMLGRSKAGKSRLVAALVAASTSRRTIELVGDDRILLRPSAEGLEARPHPRTAGFLERRGLGIVAMPWRDSAFVAGLVRLSDNVVPSTAFPENLPALRLVDIDVARHRDLVLAWWPIATSKQQRGRIVSTKTVSRREDWNW